MQSFLVSKNEAGQRLDKLLAKYMDTAPKSFFYKMLRKKNITLNGKKAEGSEKVAEGDEIKLFLADETIAGFRSGKKNESGAVEQKIPELKKHEIVYEDDEAVHVRVGAGEVWDDFVAYAVNQGWYGAENLSLIPGEVGASAVQNIGAYGMEAKDLIVNVEALDVTTGNDSVFTNTECRYAYRESIFKKEWKGRYIITYVTYRLSKSPQFHLEYGNVKGELEKQGCELTLKNVRDVIIRIREAKLPDPKVQGNAGSFFMNPVIPRMQYESLLAKYPEMPHYKVDEEWVKVPAAWMIDRCGWKGKRMGNAGVHDKQALVLVNCGGATGQEIITLSQHIQQSVYESFRIAIVPEVNFI
jgi:UDP-N-acetylmuramate dehydrogenase